MEQVAINNEHKLVRDVNSLAVLSTDVSAFTMYKERRSQAQRIAHVEHCVEELQRGMGEIKELLIQALGGK
jgi:hypothetical protein